MISNIVSGEKKMMLADKSIPAAGPRFAHFESAPGIHLVRETDGTTDPTKLRSSEWSKIRCGKARFEALGLDLGHVTKA